MGPGDLEKILKVFPENVSSELIVGLETRDDAAVFQIDETRALVQTIDFITPIVDDPFVFGQITAANALSDIYAMGGKPLTAMNLAGFPCSLDMGILGEILDGGHRKVVEAGAVVVGGHTVQDDEPKYGLAVTGIVDIDKLVTIAGAEPGDVLVLTKPIGTGILATALKRQAITEDDMPEAIASMTALNADASEAMTRVDAHAATDVTGFGLLGHLHNMMEASGTAARIEMGRIPTWTEVHDLAHQGMIAGGLNNNRQYLEPFVGFEDGIEDALKAMLYDPQTSGGLLVAVPADKADRYVELLKEADTSAWAIIGEVVGGLAGSITVEKG